MIKINIKIKCGKDTCDNCGYLHFSIGYCMIRYSCLLFKGKHIGDYKKPRLIECIKLEEAVNAVKRF
jgi:hypothetical protein